jgi:hypothetical protein
MGEKRGGKRKSIVVLTSGVLSRARGGDVPFVEAVRSQKPAGSVVIKVKIEVKSKFPELFFKCLDLTLLELLFQGFYLLLEHISGRWIAVKYQSSH